MTRDGHGGSPRWQTAREQFRRSGLARAGSGDAKLQAQAIWLGTSAVANFASEARLGGGGAKEGKGEMAGGSAI